MNRPDLTAEQLTRTRRLMDAAVPDCLVEDCQSLIAGLELPDPDDCHVLAAAIRAGCDAIVTFNLKDFPEAVLARFDLKPLHPENFILHQFGLNRAAVVIAAQRCRARLRDPPKTAGEYLRTPWRRKTCLKR